MNSNFTETYEHNHLIALGFNRYNIGSSSRNLYKDADFFYQRKVLNYDKKIMYFENIYVYDWYLRNPIRATLYSFTVETTLYYTENESITLNFTRQTIDELPLIFSKITEIYANQKCIPDPHNND